VLAQAGTLPCFAQAFSDALCTVGVGPALVLSHVFCYRSTMSRARGHPLTKINTKGWFRLMKVTFFLLALLLVLMLIALAGAGEPYWP
jgi:hypothetical protein